MLKAPYRVAVVCDFLEENWPSMDLVADMLVAHLAQNHSSEITVTQLRPPMFRFFSWLDTRLSRNADRLLNRFYYYPRWLRKRRDQFDLFHIVDHTYAHLALELPRQRTLITCHDLDAFRSILDPAARVRHSWFRHFTRRILDGFRSAPHIVCGTRATRDAALRHGLVSASSTSVVYYGVHPRFVMGNAAADAELSRLMPDRHDREICLLSVGSTIPRKRIDVLLRVFAAVRHLSPSVTLVRVGGPFTESQSQLVDELGLGGSIVVLPSLESDVLAAVYRRATLLLQTSEAEGFGLPLIEAMAGGCPVVASDIPALREIGGPATTLCPVADIDRWTGEVIRLLRERSESPGEWRDRKSSCSAWASRFTWAEHTRRIVEIYQQLIGASDLEEHQVL